MADVNMNPKVLVQSANKLFDAGRQQVIALQDATLSVQQNEFVTLVGASGCGKSTLLRLVAGLESLTSGEISVDGRPIDGAGIDRAMVFQHYSLYPWLTVRENIRFCRELAAHRAHTSAEVEAASGRTDALLNLIGMTDFSDAFPHQLSGGMQQRVAIARALMARPQILLMDEPFGALDQQTREVMHELISAVHRIERTTILFVTHDVEEAIYLGRRVVLMAPRPGRIDSTFQVPLPDRRQPNMKHSAEFLKLKLEIVDRIRETSGMKTDFEQLEKLSASFS